MHNQQHQHPQHQQKQQKQQQKIENESFGRKKKYDYNNGAQ